MKTFNQKGTQIIIFGKEELLTMLNDKNNDLNQLLKEHILGEQQEPFTEYYVNELIETDFKDVMFFNVEVPSTFFLLKY